MVVTNQHLPFLGIGTFLADDALLPVLNDGAAFCLPKHIGPRIARIREQAEDLRWGRCRELQRQSLGTGALLREEHLLLPTPQEDLAGTPTFAELAKDELDSLADLFVRIFL